MPSFALPSLSPFAITTANAAQPNAAPSFSGRETSSIIPFGEDTGSDTLDLSSEVSKSSKPGLIGSTLGKLFKAVRPSFRAIALSTAAACVTTPIALTGLAIGTFVPLLHMLVPMSMALLLAPAGVYAATNLMSGSKK
ncbi:MAG: hypothetical protein AAGI66_00300 [Cyanobacteria bacterium P01_H01_bin.74]